MKEFFEAAMMGVNLPYTFLIILVLLYWGTVFLGVIDMDSIDLDIDHDVHVDVDADADLDHDVDTDGHVSGIGKALHFFNIGDLPFMIIFSFWVMFMWVGSVLINHYIGNTNWLIAAGIFFPLAFVNLFLTKFATWPFLKVFKAMTKEEDTQVVGKVCTVMIEADESSKGQADVVTSSFHQKVTILAAPGKHLPKGSKGLVIEFDEEKQSYIVAPYE